MPSLTPGVFRLSRLAGCAACALWLGLAASPARAGDDGEAPLWVGLGSIFGFGGDNKDDTPIEYRDRSKLVLPPKVELPPPAASPVKSDAAWPRDPDLQRRKKEKAEKDNYVFVPPRQRESPVAMGVDHSVVTMDATAGEGAGERACVKGPGERCSTRPSPSINWNPLTWVGLEKKPQTVLGPEPDRDWLTDPPKGYREPVEGEGVKMDN